MIIYNDVYSDEHFVKKYTYMGNDLGAVWSKESTTFKIWAPLAKTVELALYRNGTFGVEDLLRKDGMKKGDQGVWTLKVEGDLNGIYYTYFVENDDEAAEVCDPYARTTGVNGKRAMVLNLASTNPTDWERDIPLEEPLKYTDAVLYELHIRDFSIDESSGVSEKNRGKYLAFTEEGTKTPNGTPTCLDYLTSLGITHLHLLPMYDYGSVDEEKLEEPQFNWGYDPVNYNVPEGSYSTDPFHGEVRVKEMKQMIKALHDRGIRVVMDVVYNHVYDADTFCFNKIVPGYFSRQNEDGSCSNGSYCGNDTASERPMVRKYIVDSVNYWADEYHMDGFRFDLVGLLDTETVNEIVNTVHKKHPNVIFYGEGWSLPTAMQDGYFPATQVHAAKTPDFAYFSDDIRDLLAGRNGEGEGFVSGKTDCEELVAKCFMAKTSWCPKPAQTVNYVSCHDNYTLMDKLRITRPEASFEKLVRMNKLAAAIYMTSFGIPFIHAGEELLRIKEENGRIVENSYNSSDSVNKIRWGQLDDKKYAEVMEYYKGLIKFRKDNRVLHFSTAKEVIENVTYQKLSDNVVLFKIKDELIIIFNASENRYQFDMGKYGIINGDWKICVNSMRADIEEEIGESCIEIPEISTMILKFSK